MSLRKSDCSIRELSRRLALSKPMVMTILQELEATGIITAYHVKHPSGGRPTIRYKLLDTNAYFNDVEEPESDKEKMYKLLANISKSLDRARLSFDRLALEIKNIKESKEWTTVVSKKQAG